MSLSVFKQFIFMVTLLFSLNCFALPTTIDFENINTADALRELARLMQRNLFISPNVTGVVTLHLQAAEPQAAFHMLLTSQGLVANNIGGIIYIATASEMIKRQEEASQLVSAVAMTAPLQTQTWEIHYAKAATLAHILQDNNASLLSKRGHLRIDERTNSICVQDIAVHLAQLNRLIHHLDIPIRQVRIEARLVSVDADYERALGVNFSVHVPGAVTEAPTQRFSLAVATLADGSLLDIALAAMENQGRGELLSRPSLFTASLQTAVIESGEEIPYQEVSLSGGTGVAFKKAVLSLKATPQIMPGNRVLLQLTINQDRPSNRIVLGVPAITTRQITTNVFVKSGQTLVLGGIYELNKEYEEQRIPFLGKIPVVGILFRQQNIKENKRELLIFVTPKIISYT